MSLFCIGDAETLQIVGAVLFCPAGGMDFQIKNRADGIVEGGKQPGVRKRFLLSNQGNHRRRVHCTVPSLLYNRRCRKDCGWEEEKTQMYSDRGAGIAFVGKCCNQFFFIRFIGWIDIDDIFFRNIKRRRQEKSRA